ncbi:serine/threonine-protein kinase [Promicromonospora sukumoe]|uniref:serine/threonine-protein kinase n=1 Tax=Promicromonospora sukumoe TaxID=88382 RepID=UPI0003A0DDD2|nr:serine/threonine-protein kinase [Promicromonospora sukumoe]
MTSPAPGVGEVAPAAVGPGPVPSTDPGPAAAPTPTPELPPVPAPPAPEPTAELPPVPAPPTAEADQVDAVDAVDAVEPEPSGDDEPGEAESAGESAPVPALPADEPVPAPPADEVAEVVEVVEPEPTPEPEPVAEPAPAPAPRAAALPMRPVRRIPASGERLGRFTLAEALGHGGFAHVYQAQADDGTEVALKVLTGLHDDARERFAQEAHLLERLDGRGFPRFVEAGLDATQPWFAMELVPGTTLRDRVREEGPLSGPEALRLARQIVDALLVLQEERCLHRDLKPANIMVDGDRAVLIDLGIAKVFDAATSTQPAGTMAYMAPELFGRRVHPRSDVYSLGLLLVYASTGELPLDLNFLGRDLTPADLVEEEPAGVVPDDDPLPERPVIDKHLQSLVLAMTRYQPNHRPPLENIASVVRARIASTTPDPTLLLTSQLVIDGVTAAEVAALPATDILPGRGHTKLFQRDVDRADEITPTRVPEPWHALVYDRALMSVLTEVHADGFDGAAEQVVANHIAEIGAEVAGGRTPAEIKDWIWQAMRWRVTTPPDGHADTLRGWRTFRSPEPAPASKRAPVTSRPRSVTPVGSPAAGSGAAPASAAATQVVRSQVPPPQSYQPRKSSVKHLGPTPKQAGPAESVRATRPMPTLPAGQPPRQAGGARAGTQPARTSGTPAPRRPTQTQRQPAAQPTRQPQRQPGTPAQRQPGTQAAPQPARQPAGKRSAAARPQSVQPGRPPSAQPGTQARPPVNTPAPRKRPRALRVLGALLRWVPRLLLLAAGYVLLTQDAQGGDPFLAAPVLGTAAFGLAVLLRVAGHRMWIWVYVLCSVLIAAASALMWAASTGQLVL